MRRIAVAESMRTAAEAALLRLVAPRPELLFPELPAETRLRLRWQRVWQERRRGSGESEAEAEAALRDSSARAMIATLDRQASGVCLAAADALAAVAWKAIEPLPGRPAPTDFWIGELEPGGSGGVMGWCDWPVEGPAAAAAALRAAAAELERLGAGQARPVALDWRGGREDTTGRAGGLGEVLGARGAGVELRMYSPLFYPDGQLDAAAVARHLRAAAGATPVVCAPRLAREEFAAAIERAGGSWAGPLRAGGEIPAAMLPKAASTERVAATLRWLARGSE
jgi:hypothetical protein